MRQYTHGWAIAKGRFGQDPIDGGWWAPKPEASDGQPPPSAGFFRTRARARAQLRLVKGPRYHGKIPDARVIQVNLSWNETR
jgi:hypothetical protein